MFDSESSKEKTVTKQEASTKTIWEAGELQDSAKTMSDPSLITEHCQKNHEHTDNRTQKFWIENKPCLWAGRPWPPWFEGSGPVTSVSFTAETVSAQLT